MTRQKLAHTQKQLEDALESLKATGGVIHLGKGSFIMPGLLPRNITIIGSGDETTLTYFGAEGGQENIKVSGLEILPSIKDKK